MTEPEYVYGRIRVLNRIADRFLGQPVFKALDDESKEAVLYAYASSRAEAMEFARDVFALATELTAVARDLQAFIKDHETDKWED